MKNKELEQEVRELSYKIRNLRPNEVVDVGEVQDVLGRVLGFIDYCKFMFGEDITDPDHDLGGEETE